MIYSFGANNYFSFKNGFEVSLEFNSKVPKVVSKSRKASTVLGIKGGNASGKSNILKTIRFISNFITLSFKNDANDKIRVKGYFNDPAPTDFYIDFESNGVRYTYEASVTEFETIREALYKKISRKTLILERKNNTIKYRTAELAELDLVTLKSKASIIDTVLQYKIQNIGEDISNVYEFFDKVRGNVGSYGLIAENAMKDPYRISEYYFNSPEALEFAKKIIYNSDLGITDIVIHETTDEDGKPKYFPIFHHNSDSNSEKDNWLTYWHQSEGTTALFRRLYYYWATLRTGGTLIMDEFDTNYHPALLPQILDLFINEESNPKNAQFIFTSHNLEIMDYLGKYRTYLVSKENSESFCYRLDEIPGDIIRNDRPISNLYREGKLGGVPKI